MDCSSASRNLWRFGALNKNNYLKELSQWSLILWIKKHDWIIPSHTGLNVCIINTTSSWWFQPLWKILVKLEIFPNFRGENKKYLSCHHLDFISSETSTWNLSSPVLFVLFFSFSDCTLMGSRRERAFSRYLFSGSFALQHDESMNDGKQVAIDTTRGREVESKEEEQKQRSKNQLSREMQQISTRNDTTLKNIQQVPIVNRWMFPKNSLKVIFSLQTGIIIVILCTGI